MGLLAGFVELEKENIPSRKVFFLSLSLSLFREKQIIRLSAPTKHPKRCNIIGEFGCFFTRPSTKVRYLSPLFYFHTFCYRE